MRSNTSFKVAPWLIFFGAVFGLLHYHLVVALVLSAVGCSESVDPCTVSPVQETLISILWAPLSKLPGTPIADYFGIGPGLAAEEFELSLDSAIWALSAMCVGWALMAQFRRGP